MKISVEEIKGLNVTGYIEFLEKKLGNIHIATVAFPYYVERRNDLYLNTYEWHSYFIQKGDYNNYWFERYNEIAKKHKEKINTQIEETTNDLLDIVHFIEKTNTNIFMQNPNETMTRKCLKMAKNIDFEGFKKMADWNKTLFTSSVEYDKNEIIKKMRFNENAVKDKIKELAETDFVFADSIKEGVFCSAYFYDSGACLEFATLEFYKWLATYNDQKQPLYKPTKTLSKTQFSELVKALFEAKVLEYETEKQGVEALALAFGVEIEKPQFDKILQKIKGRNEDTETMFLDTITASLKNWIDKN
ncbi:MAG: hypothetical protein Q4G63_07760 [Bacteroidia bacterium]|nr:hypothetical protein [Bacteroidia bacterium]